MKEIISKVLSKKWVFRSLFSTIYFNFHYLPFRQAIFLPIFLYKPKLLKCKGRVIINKKNSRLSPGMITLGNFGVSLFPNSGIVIENEGTIEFRGHCHIGNNSFVSIGKSGHVVFGDKFNCTTSLKLTSYYHIEFGENVLVGWNCLFMDTDFHKLKRVDGKDVSKPYGKIIIEDETWIGAHTTVMKNTYVPAKCVVASNSILRKCYDCPAQTLIAGNPAKVILSGVYRDYRDDVIIYEKD